MSRIVILLLTALIGMSCTRSNQDDPQTTLRVRIEKEPPTLDWNKATDTDSRAVILNIMEPLITYGFNGSRPVLKPALAEKWTSERGGKTWVVRLRKGVTWSDGHELGAGQVVDSFERLLNPQTGAFNAYHYFVIDNAKDYNSGKLKDFSRVGVKARDGLTIVFNLDRPVVYFPKLLAMLNVMPIRKDLIEKYKDQWTDAENLVTLGAFRLKEWAHDKELVLERNDSYFGQTPGRAPGLEKVRLKIVTEDATALNLFDSGDIDALNALPLVDLKALHKRPEFHQTSDLAIEYFGFNTKVKPFDNVFVRRAIAHAINRKEITEVLGGGYRPNSMFLPHGVFGRTNRIGLDYDPDRTREYLKKAGYASPADVPRLVFTYYTDGNQKRLAENIQAQLKRVGLNVELRNMEWKTYLQKVNTEPPAMYRLGWLAVYPDPNLFMSLFTSDSAFNTSGWDSAQYDRLVKKAAEEKRIIRRADFYQSAARILVEDAAVVVPLYSGARHYMVHKRVHGYPLNSLFQLTFKDVSLK